MIVRIVKMDFELDKVEQFKADFEQIKSKVRNFEGCHHLELWQKVDEPNIIFTHSHWKSETALENYRHSDTFKGIWANTKPLFNKKAEAWSVNMINKA